MVSPFAWTVEKHLGIEVVSQGAPTPDRKGVMRYPEDKIKEAILHPDLDVRDTAIRYFYSSTSPDDTFMPLAIQAIERYGRTTACSRRRRSVPAASRRRWEWHQSRRSPAEPRVGLVPPQLATQAADLGWGHSASPARIRFLLARESSCLEGGFQSVADGPHGNLAEVQPVAVPGFQGGKSQPPGDGE
jgi:hypothetical protein